MEMAVTEKNSVTACESRIEWRRSFATLGGTSVKVTGWF